MSTSGKRLSRSALLVGIALSATYPLFIETYRSMAFQTTPRDDYAPYLLALTGEGPRFDSAPMVYRVLSVAVAIPAYHALPLLRFSKLPDSSEPYLRATQALAFVSWLALAALAVLMYRIARDRLGASASLAGVAFFATPLYAHYTGLYGVDPLALALIAAAYYWLGSPITFAGILVASTAFNEKVVIVLTLLMAGRLIASPRDTLRRFPLQLFACALGLVAYVVVRSALKFPGNEHQLQPLTYLENARALLALTVSLKGLFQNVLPTMLVLAAYAFVLWRRGGERETYWAWGDVAVPLGLLAVGVSINVELTLGRLVFHALPLILPAAVASLQLPSPARDAGDHVALPATSRYSAS